MHKPVAESFTYIPSGNYQLSAMIGTPSSPVKDNAPTIVFCHGFGGTKTEACRHFVRLTNKLVPKGFTTIRFDFAGFGDSIAPSTAFSISQGISDIRAVLDYMQANGIGSLYNLGILGFSFGGLIVSYAIGAGLPFRCACLISPVERLIPQKPSGDKNQQDDDTEPFFRGFKLSHRFIEEFIGCSGSKELSKADIPVQLFHGSDDQTVPVDHMQTYALVIDTAQTPPVIIDGGDHTYTKRAFQDQLDRKVVQFFSKTML